jgi:hypothetical protein
MSAVERQLYGDTLYYHELTALQRGAGRRGGVFDERFDAPCSDLSMTPEAPQLQSIGTGLTVRGLHSSPGYLEVITFIDCLHNVLLDSPRREMMAYDLGYQDGSFGRPSARN